MIKQSFVKFVGLLYACITERIGLCLQDAHDLFDVFTTTLDEETSRAHRTPSVFDLSAIQVPA